MDAVIRGGSDKQHGCDCSGQKADKMDYLPRTTQMFKALGIDRSCLVAINGRNEVLQKSARNIDRTTVTSVQQLNAWDILRNRTLLVTKAGLQQILA